MKSRLRSALALVGSLTLVVSSCGGDDDDDASTDATDAPTEATASAEGSTPATEGGGDGEEVTLSLLIDDTETTNLLTNGLTEAFTALHPNITFDIEQRPGGADGDNIVKTRLSTGEMSDVFFYNSGSLLQALNPEESMVEITGDPMLDDVVDAFIPTVTQNGKVFGVPFGTGMGGGVLYNRAIFEEQGLEVPLTWEEFAANNDALKAAGVTPVGASFGTTWTSQLFVLADYHNVAEAEPELRRGVHGEPGEVRHDTGRTHELRTSRGGLRQGLVERGLRVGDVRRRPGRCCSTARSRSTRCSRSHCRRWQRSIPRRCRTSASSPSPGRMPRPTG